MSMLEGLSEEFNGTFFIGYHAKSGSFGVLSHTYAGRVVAYLKLNGRYVAKCPSPEKVRKVIKEGAFRAVNQLKEGEIKVINVPFPVEVQLKFLNPGMANLAQILPGSEKIDPLTLRYVAKDMFEAYKAVRSMIYLGYAAIK